MIEGLTFNEFQRMNVDRCLSSAATRTWGDYTKRDLRDWAICLAGESGEVLNAVKKYSMYAGDDPAIRRERYLHILDEVADVITYAFLLLDYCSENVEDVVMKKFYEVSKRISYVK